MYLYIYIHQTTDRFFLSIQHIYRPTTQNSPNPPKYLAFPRLKPLCRHSRRQHKRRSGASDGGGSGTKKKIWRLSTNVECIHRIPYGYEPNIDGTWLLIETMDKSELISIELQFFMVQIHWWTPWDFGSFRKASPKCSPQVAKSGEAWRLSNHLDDDIGYTQILRGAGIFTYITGWFFRGFYVGKYSSTMVRIWDRLPRRIRHQMCWSGLSNLETWGFCRGNWAKQKAGHQFG